MQKEKTARKKKLINNSLQTLYTNVTNLVVIGQGVARLSGSQQRDGISKVCNRTPFIMFQVNEA